MSTFRPHNLMVSGGVFHSLRALAATKGISTPDQLADILLAERLAAESEVEFRREKFDAAMKQIDKEARAKFPSPAQQ